MPLHHGRNHPLEAQEETGGEDEQKACQEVAKITLIPDSGDGVNLDNWGLNSRGGELVARSLHLYHHGGLPGSVGIHCACCPSEASPRRVFQAVEKSGKNSSRLTLGQALIVRVSKGPYMKLSYS